MAKDSVQIVVDSLKYNSQLFEESKKYLESEGYFAPLNQCAE